jgi:N-acetylglucosaminyl-diphospho-decaprenol L-rhamnosyltransferase
VTEQHAEISVVIVTWNSRQAVLECLASLVACPPSRRWEAIVVDNGSRDCTVEAVEREHPWAHIVPNARNRGLPAANNQGLLAARGEYVIVSNPDVVYGPGAIDALCDLLDRRPTAALAFARLLDPSGAVQTCAGDLPTVLEAIGGRARRTHGSATSGFWWHGWAHDQEVQIGHGGESCYAARRSAVVEFGLQDERFRLDWEGIDWAARAREGGWEVWFCPAAQVIHGGGVSIRQARARWVVWSHRGMYLYFARRRPALRPLLAAAVAARAAAKLALLASPLDLYERAH